jgi:predicted transcriptional regulator
MAKRTLTITVTPDWRDSLRSAGRMARATHYQGERLNFESPVDFFGRLSGRCWALVQLLMGADEMPVHELARRAGRNVKRVNEDVVTLEELGLVERTSTGEVRCPFADIHLDMHLREAV